jgi:hypothetical protein
MADLERIEPHRFETTHQLRTTTGDGRDMVVLSGYAVIRNFSGNPDGTWNRKDLVFRVGPRWTTVETVPVVTITAIQNANVANNAGWAVDNCRVEDVFEPSTNSRTKNLICQIAARDSDGDIIRVNYYVTMVGRLA